VAASATGKSTNSAVKLFQRQRKIKITALTGAIIQANKKNQVNDAHCGGWCKKQLGVRVGKLNALANG